MALLAVVADPPAAAVALPPRALPAVEVARLRAPPAAVPHLRQGPPAATVAVGHQVLAAVAPAPQVLALAAAALHLRQDLPVAAAAADLQDQEAARALLAMAQGHQVQAAAADPRDLAVARQALALGLEAVQAHQALAHQDLEVVQEALLLLPSQSPLAPTDQLAPRLGLSATAVLSRLPPQVAELARNLVKPFTTLPRAQAQGLAPLTHQAQAILTHQAPATLSQAQVLQSRAQENPSPHQEASSLPTPSLALSLQASAAVAAVPPTLRELGNPFLPLEVSSLPTQFRAQHRSRALASHQVEQENQSRCLELARPILPGQGQPQCTPAVLASPFQCPGLVRPTQVERAQLQCTLAAPASPSLYLAQARSTQVEQAQPPSTPVEQESPSPFQEQARPILLGQAPPLSTRAEQGSQSQSRAPAKYTHRELDPPQFTQAVRVNQSLFQALAKSTLQGLDHFQANLQRQAPGKSTQPELGHRQSLPVAQDLRHQHLAQVTPQAEQLPTLRALAQAPRPSPAELFSADSHLLRSTFDDLDVSMHATELRLSVIGVT